MSIYIGCCGMPVTQDQYFNTFNAVEVLPSQEVPPKPSSVRRLLDAAPEGFAFSMVASRFISVRPDRLPPGLEGDPQRYGGLQLTEEVLSLTERTMTTAAELGARAVVFVTTPSIRPGPRGRETLARFFSALDRRGMLCAWEPHGPWDEGEISKMCEDLGLIRCFDPLRDSPPDGSVAYARLGPFAVMGRAIADDELESIIETLEGYDEAYCFFGTERAFSDARRLLSMTQT